VEDRSDISLEEAIEVIKSKNNNNLGTFVSGTKTFLILDGKFGKYIKATDSKNGRSINVTLPKNTDIGSLDVDKINIIIKNHYGIKSDDKKIIDDGNKNKKKIVKKNK
jgi:topoisomerase IA-like protein